MSYLQMAGVTKTLSFVLLQKDGALLPGKKGIFLKPAEFKLVAGNVAAISAAAASQNMQYTLDLGAM